MLYQSYLNTYMVKSFSKNRFSMLIFGSISYLNLLPFQIFLKKYIKNSQIKQIINYKKGVPSNINIKFKKRQIDAAFISSIKSKNQKCSNVGILADGAVYSVLVINDIDSFDCESDTSNALSKVLNIKGKVIIGDKALKCYLKSKNIEFKDLSLEWKKKTNLPFVFARLCYKRNGKVIKKIGKKFTAKKVKIPQYYLKRAALSKGITPKELLWYLDKIKYKIEYKEEKSLKLFLKKASKI